MDNFAHLPLQVLSPKDGAVAKRVVEEADPYIMWLYLHHAAQLVGGGLPDAPFLRFATTPEVCEGVVMPKLPRSAPPNLLLRRCSAGWGLIAFFDRSQTRRRLRQLRISPICNRTYAAYGDVECFFGVNLNLPRARNVDGNVLRDKAARLNG